MGKNILVLIFSLFIVGCSVQASDEYDWEESKTIVIDAIVSDDGKKGKKVFRIGDNGKIAIGEYAPFIAKDEQKYMWHFWGDKKTLTKPLKVIAVSKETNEEMVIFNDEGVSTLSPNNGADHHIPSRFALPNSGLWRLKVYFGDDLFGNVIVNVNEK